MVENINYVNPEIKENMNFNSYILEKQPNGEIQSKEENSSGDFINQYQAKLAVLDDQGVPYGEVDNFLIENNPENLIVVKDIDHQPSIEIMSGAIKKASEDRLTSIAISSDTLDEIKDVELEITKLLSEDKNIQKIGFFYPGNK